MKMKYLLMSLLLVGITSSANAAVLGTDSFKYPDGSIAGLSGGTGWDAGGVSDWNVAWGTPAISGRALRTQDSGVIREFGADENAGAVQAAGQIYFGATMTVTADNYSWGGISSYDFGSERIFFGCPGAQSALGPNGLGYYGIDIPGDPANALTTIPIVKNQPARIVGCIDFDGDQMLMWVNPDAEDYDNGGGDNSADAVLAWTSTNWCTAVRLASFNAVTWDDLIVAGTLEEALYLNMAHHPQPAFGQKDVLVGGLKFSWAIPQVPSQGDPELFVADPNLAAFELRYSLTDPNLDAASPISITAWDAGTLRASYTPAQELAKDSTCFWRVDSVMDDATVIQGINWLFYTQLTKAIILSDPAYQIVDAGATAIFSVGISTESPATYQWYRYVDGISDIMLTDGGDISGAMTDTLSIAHAALEDEGRYYCIVNNQSQIEVVSKQALLAVKRKLAYWPFEGGSFDSAVTGSPASVIVGAPTFTSAGIAGDAMVIVNNVDMLYTDPNLPSYFDICDYEMTVACWVKTTDKQPWCALVSRNGEGEGWQLRQSGFTDDRPCFTTRGTGNDDGTPANRTIYDNKWHYVVATLDGNVKKVYIDGILSRRYSVDGGNVELEADEVNIPVRKSLAPVAIAGRVWGNVTDGLNVEINNNVAGTYDEVEIYNYPLDAATIAQNYADVTGTDVCLGQAFDLDNDCTVDLNDLGSLAAEWLNDGIIGPML